MVHALDGVMKWVNRDEWADAFAECRALHFDLACKEAGLDYDDLRVLLGDQHFYTLHGCVLEDFMATDLEDGYNVADDYLKRRGWKESPSERANIAALRHSVVSLYEVAGVVPGASFMARDLIRGGDPILISERSATRTLRPGDRLALRALTVRDKTTMAGGVLVFDVPTSDKLIAMIDDLVAAARAKHRPPAKSRKVGIGRAMLNASIGTLTTRDTILPGCAFIITTFWLRDALQRILGPVPELRDGDGDPIEFLRLVYPLAAGVHQKAIRAALATIPDLRLAGKNFWNWLRPESGGKRPGGLLAPALPFTTTADDGAAFLGSVELKGRQMALSTLSASRAERGRAMLDKALGGLVGEPAVEEVSLDELTHDLEREAAASPLSTDEERAVIHEYLDRHYRLVLDCPVAMLGEISPRQAAKGANKQEKLVSWLKYVENSAARADEAIAGYDFTWMWKDLGLLDRRR